MSVSARVYVAARAPDAGEEFGALAAKFRKPPASDRVVRANGFFWLSEEAFLRDFAGDLEPGRARTSTRFRDGEPSLLARPVRAEAVPGEKWSAIFKAQGASVAGEANGVTRVVNNIAIEK